MSSSSLSTIDESKEVEQEAGDKYRKQFEFVESSSNARMCVIAELVQTAMRILECNVTLGAGWTRSGWLWVMISINVCFCKECSTQ